MLTFVLWKNHAENGGVYTWMKGWDKVIPREPPLKYIGRVPPSGSGPAFPNSPTYAEIKVCKVSTNSGPALGVQATQKIKGVGPGQRKGPNPLNLRGQGSTPLISGVEVHPTN